MEDIHLIIQSYPCTNDERRDELFTVLRRNLANPVVAFVHDICEPDTSIPEDILNNPKYIQEVIDQRYTKKTSERFPVCSWLPYPDGFDPKQNDLSKRLTFAYAIKYINDTIEDGEIVCIANNDIIIDDTEESEWSNLNKNFFDLVKKNKRALVLSRHETNSSGEIWKDNHAFKSWSQDAWVLKTPLSPIPSCNFTVGNCPTGENAFSFRLWVAGYQVFNLANIYKIFHLDRIQKGEKQYYVGNFTDYSFPGWPVDLTNQNPKWPIDWRALDVCPYMKWDAVIKHDRPFDVSIYFASRDCPYGEHNH